MKKTIFITGTSSGLGKASAKYFADLGWNVAATMRTPEKETELTNYPGIKVFKLDITNLAEVASAIRDAIAAFGKVDVVLNNAGMGVYGALELAKEADIDQQFAVNVRGAINVIRAFLPHFRENGVGKFINVSSFMGVTTGTPLGSLYNMSKFALEGLTEGLYYELRPLNISLHLIEQGGSTDNDFIKKMTWNTSNEIKDYQALTTKVDTLFKSNDPFLKEDTLTLVKVIVGLATGESNKFRTVIGKTGNDLMAMRNSMPIEQYLESIYANFV